LRFALLAWVVGLGACQQENPGLALHIDIPAAAVTRIDRIVVRMTAPGAMLPMADTGGSGVSVHTDGNTATLTFARSSFAISGAIDVLLVPSHGAVTVSIAGDLFDDTGAVIGSAAPLSGIMLAPDQRTSATLSFSCAASTCIGIDGGPPPDEIDLAAPPPAPKIVDIRGIVDNDELYPVAIGGFGLVAVSANKQTAYLFRVRDFTAANFATSYSAGNADVTISARGNEAFDGAAVGDFNGDGLDDLVLTATNAPATGGGASGGAAYLFYGHDLASATTLDLSSSDLSTVVRVFDNTVGEKLGTTAVLAHLRNHAVADLVLLAPGAHGGANRRAAGRAYVVFGSAAPPFAVTVGDGGEQDATILGPSADTQFGLAAAAGDIDGDGRAELAIGNYADSGGGTVHVIRGSRFVRGATFDLAATSPPLYDLRIAGASNSQFGWSVTAADVDGDGRAELIVGARATAAVYVFAPLDALMSTGRLDVAQNQFELALLGAANTRFGEALGAGNLDGDGASDLLVGAPGANGPNGARASGGEAFVVRGSTLGALTTGAARSIDLVAMPPALIVWGARAGDEAGGQVLAGAFDISDSTDEIIVGAKLGGLNKQGVVYVVADLPAAH
jgi:hypothetical protein